MSRPLQFGDPDGLGPFRLGSRLHESAAGIVYLGTDAQGRVVSVALLTSAAAGDAAARDRFRAAIVAETARPGVSPAEPVRAAAVVAAQPEGEAPWVATAYEEGVVGAERFLEPVLLRRGGGLGRRRRGPQFQPYWLSGSKGPAVRTRADAPAAAGARAVAGDRGLAAAVLGLAALLALLALLVVLLFSCEPSEPEPPPGTPPPVPTTSAPTPTPTPSTRRPTPSPSGSPSRTPRPSPTGGESDAPANPAGR